MEGSVDLKTEGRPTGGGAVLCTAFIIPTPLHAMRQSEINGESQYERRLALGCDPTPDRRSNKTRPVLCDRKGNGGVSDI